MSKTYKELKLSDVKKERMIQMIKKGIPPTSKKKSFVPIVAPLFALVSVFLFFLTTGDHSRQLITGAGLELTETDHVLFFKEVIIYWSISLLFIMTAYVQFILLATKPERLVEYRIFKWAHEALHTWRRVFLIAFPFAVIIIETIILFISSSQLMLHLAIVLFFLTNSMLIQLRFVKNKTRATCPNCEVELTNKEIFYNRKCGVCGKKRHLIIQNSSYEMVSTFMGLLIVFLPSFGFNMIFVPIYLIIYMSFTYAYIIPYIRKYSKEDIIPPPLW